MSKLICSAYFIIAGAFVLSGCSSGPLHTISAGDELESYNFAEGNTFEEGAYADATLRIIDGVYRIALNQGDSEVWWAQWGASLGDVMIDVDLEQISEANENAYGVACRLRGQVGHIVEADADLFAVTNAEAGAEASPEMTAEATAEATAEVTEEAEASVDTSAEDTAANGDGYLFLIRGNGSFALLRAHNRQINALVNWTQSDLIEQGAASNQLRAVCAGNYLALYINGEFAADATDDSYSSGQVGLAASASGRLGAIIEFDNLTVHEAKSA